MIFQTHSERIIHGLEDILKTFSYTEEIDKIEAPDKDNASETPTVSKESFFSESTKEPGQEEVSRNVQSARPGFNASN